MIRSRSHGSGVLLLTSLTRTLILLKWKNLSWARRLIQKPIPDVSYLAGKSAIGLLGQDISVEAKLWLADVEYLIGKPARGL